MKIIPITTANFNEEELLEFFDAYPFEVFYSFNLGIEKHYFIRFLINKLKRAVKGKGKLWALKNDSKLLAIIGLDHEMVLSRNYDMKIFVIHNLYNYINDDPEQFSMLLSTIEDAARNGKAKMIKIKIDADDHLNINYLMREHYHYYASSCKLYHKISDESLKAPTTHEDYRIRPFREADKENALSILRQHKKNEKYYNMDLSNERTTALFDDYFISQSQKNHGTFVMILEEIRTNEVKGLSIYSEAASFSKQLGKSLVTWDLIVIDQNSRGEGLGRLFFDQLIHNVSKDIEVSTMSDNLQMQKFLHKCGFYKVGEFIHLYRNLY